jgi:hypothetical protein
MLKKFIPGLFQLELAEVNSANSPKKLGVLRLRFLAGHPWPASSLLENSLLAA